MNTKNEYQELLKISNEFINNVIEKKYLVGDEKNYNDVINRFETAFPMSDHKSRIFKMLKAKRYIPGGSISFGLGNDDIKCSLSNCYYVPILEDSIEGIFDCLKKIARVFSYRGGSGVDISILRPKNSPVKNAAKQSTGSVSFMPLFSNVSYTIGQNGRRGAEILMMDCRHPDLLDFIWCKSKPKEVFGKDFLTGKIPDVNDANISVKVTDSFMEAVEDDREWTLFFPDTQCEQYSEWDGDFDVWVEKGYPVIEYDSMSARYIMQQLSEANWTSGDPGILFWDRIKNMSPGIFDSKLVPKGVNPCLPSWAPVLTPQGYKHFKNINNEVLIDKTDHKCSNLIKTGNDRTIWEIELKSGLTLYATKNHKVQIIDKSQSNLIKSNRKLIFKDKEIGELTSDDLVHVDYSPVQYDRDDQFHKNWKDGFVAGWVFGDGSVIHTEKTKPTVSFILGIVEFEFEQTLLNIIHDVFHDNELNFRPHGQKPDTCKFLSTKKKNNIEIFRNLFGCFAKDEFDLLTKPLSFQIGFIDAFTMADGHVVNREKRSQQINLDQSGSRGFRILKQIQLVLCSLGIYSNHHLTNNSKKDPREFNCKEVWRLAIIDPYEFNKHFKIYNSTKQSRLTEICKHQLTHKNSRLETLKTFQKIKTIKKLEYKYDVYDIQVPGINHFVSSGIVIHNCGEQPLANWNNCLLSALIMHKYVSDPYTHQAKFNTELFLEDVKYGIIFLDTLIDINNHPLSEQTEADLYGRRVGQEFTGLADMLAMLGMKYGSDESCEFLDNLLSAKCITEINTSIQLAKELGCAPCFKTNVSRQRFLKTPYIKQIMSVMTPDQKTIFKQNVLEHGLRNSAWNTNGPTGTISIIADNCTSGIEPLFNVVTYRKTRLKPDEETKLFHYPLLKYVGPELLSMSKDEIKRKFNYLESNEISHKTRIKIQSTVQKWCDSSVSSTINLPKDCLPQEIYDIYIEGFRQKLKGVTVYRDGSKDRSVLSSEKEIGGIKKPDIEAYLAIMKEKLLEPHRAMRFVQSWKGLKVYITVTLDDNGQPLEIFAKLPPEAGMDEEGFEVPGLYLEQKSYWDAICRLTSLGLRAGIPIEMIAKQLSKSSTSMVTLPAIILRSIKRFLDTSQEKCDQIKNKQCQGGLCPSCKEYGMVYRQGCKICLFCGDSICG